MSLKMQPQRRQKRVVGRRVTNMTADRGHRKPVGWQPPAIRLKALRNRAGLRALECAKLSQVGVTAGAWFRYESANKRDMGDGPIPDDVILRILPHMVGRGVPPIREEELLSLAKGRELMRAMKDRSQRTLGVPVLRLQDVAPTFPKTADGVKHLVVRHRAERGTYMTREAFDKRTFGVGPITEAPEYGQGQSCVLIVDDHAGNTYPAGTVLHIIHHSAYQPHELVGKRVVLVVEKMSGLVSAEVAVVHDVRGNTFNFRTLDGDEPIDGELVGVVYRSLRKE